MKWEVWERKRGAVRESVSDGRVIIVCKLPIKLMERKNLSAISFLKSQDLREKYECGICYEVCIKPVRCKGSCARIFCMKCVSDTRQALDRCPFKCSAPFLVQPLPDLLIQFHCPYNPLDCSLPITSLKQFHAHHTTCPFVSPEQSRQKQLQAAYRCMQGHQLQFFIGSYEEMLESTCVSCQEQKLCRSFCRICDQLYCVGCRVPPCAKAGCPIGHTFNFQRIANLNYICDICGISTAVSNDGVYDDNFCNFGICEACYSSLPEQFDPSQPRQLIANISSQCACGQKLRFRKREHMSQICSLCTKMKECPRECESCQRRYCLSCKIVEVQNDNTCGVDHQTELIEMEGDKMWEREMMGSGCMRCGRTSNSYQYDHHCGWRLCMECLAYCKRVTSQKQRPLMMKCEINHVLIYITGPQDYYDECSKCHRTKIIKLKCIFCEQDRQNYCFECRPVPLATCYYKHPLRLASFASERECHYCLENYDQFYFCKKCYFYVCRGCVENSLHEHMHAEEDTSSHLPLNEPVEESDHF